MSSLSGSLNKLGNFILLIALSHVDSSVQYPMVTGGIIIVSTIISYFGDKKPNKKELLSVAAAFLGLLFLFILP
jgi:drug/metabolite transporter (DMT)-like permease